MGPTLRETRSALAAVAIARLTRALVHHLVSGVCVTRTRKLTDLTQTTAMPVLIWWRRWPGRGSRGQRVEVVGSALSPVSLSQGWLRALMGPIQLAWPLVSHFVPHGCHRADTTLECALSGVGWLMCQRLFAPYSRPSAEPMRQLVSVEVSVVILARQDPLRLGDGPPCIRLIGQLVRPTLRHQRHQVDVRRPEVR